MQISIDELRNLVKVTDLSLLRELCNNCKNSYDNDTNFVISLYDPQDKDLSFIANVAVINGLPIYNWVLVSITRYDTWGIVNNNLFDTLYETLEFVSQYSSWEIKVLDRREWIRYLNKITSEI